jgi:hypothetical protein
MRNVGPPLCSDLVLAQRVVATRLLHVLRSRRGMPELTRVVFALKVGSALGSTCCQPTSAEQVGWQGAQGCAMHRVMLGRSWRDEHVPDPGGCTRATCSLFQGVCVPCKCHTNPIMGCVFRHPASLLCKRCAA